MKKITKAVIPAAGLGTRMLPIAYAVPKEMLPIVDLPAICYLVEEAVNSGITDVLIITNRGKESIEDFFDLSPEYISALTQKGKITEAKRIRDIAKMANIHFIRQKEANGLAGAVKCAEAFVSGEPFAVLYGDDVIFSKTPVCRQLMKAYERYGKAVAGVKRVPREDLKKYCSLKVEPLGDEIFSVSDMIEKPSENEEFSDLAILGRVILTPEIFERIDKLERGAGGEYQLTDAMAALARDKGMTAVVFEGERYDLGSKLGFLKANVCRALQHEEVKEDFREFLKKLSDKL